MSITTVTEGKIHTIKVVGQFDFNVQREFRAAYESIDTSMNFIIDFQKVDYMDSSALGMILLLRDYVGATQGKITLAHCNSEIRSILDVSNFQKLFTLT